MSLSLTGLYTGILGFIMVFLAMRVSGAGLTSLLVVSLSIAAIWQWFSA